MSIKISSRKSKARRLQDLTASKVSECIGLPWGKDQPIEPRQMGGSGVDLRLDREAIKKFPFSVECKNQENWSVPAWIDQAKSNILPNTDWLLICSKNRFTPVVILDLDAFLKLIK